MSRFLITTALAVFIAAATLPVKAQAPIIEKPASNDVRGMISYYADKFNANKEEMLAVSFCESGYNPKAWNKNDPNGGSFGHFQFQKRTFYSYAKILNIQNPDIWNVEHQTIVAAYMFSIGQQKQWSCSKIVGIL